MFRNQRGYDYIAYCFVFAILIYYIMCLFYPPGLKGSAGRALSLDTVRHALNELSVFEKQALISPISNTISPILASVPSNTYQIRTNTVLNQEKEIIIAFFSDDILREHSHGSVQTVLCRLFFNICFVIMYVGFVSIFSVAKVWILEYFASLPR